MFKAISVFVVLLALCGFAFAQPMLQVSNYTLIPGEIYPGTIGYAQLMITNVGDATAGAVTTHYNYNVGGESVDSVGDIAAGSSARVLVPFQIHQQGGTIQVLSVDVYYVSSSNTGQSSLKSSISIPLLVSQYSPLEVRTLSKDHGTISAGEDIVFTLGISNTGGVMNNLIISMPENSSFSIMGNSQLNVGNVPADSNVTTYLSLSSSSDSKTGSYSVPVVFSYQDASSIPHNQTLMIGPLSVLDSTSQYRISLVPMQQVEIGSDVPFNLTITNTGSSPISGIVVINSTSIFTPIGMQKVYFDMVPPGASVSQEVNIGVSSSAGSGFYTIPLTLTTSNGNPAAFQAGVMVSATPEITVSLDSSSGTPQVTVANTGNSQIRSVYVSVTPEGSQTSTESFVGTLNVDDFASVSLGTGTFRSVSVRIRFRDSDNQEQSVTKTLQPTSGNSSFVQQGGRNGTGASGNFSRTQSPLGFLLGPSSRNGSSTGPDLTTMVIAGIVVVAIVGYGVYHFVWKKRKAK